MRDEPFNTGEPLAYFLTWTTYGTWLPGDERGWNRKGDHALLEPDPLLVRMAQAKMTEPVFVLSDRHRVIVEETIREHCRIRNWPLHAVNARSNHVHVVVTAIGYKPKTVRDQLKAWCTTKLKEAGESRTHFWTEGGSQRWINTDEELEAAVAYVLEAQDRKGLERG